MIKLLASSPIPWDSTSFYRSFGTFRDLRRQLGNDIEIHSYYASGRKFTWAELQSYDIVFFQRPARPDDVQLLDYCKNLGIKVWVDYDDNLFQVPNESRAFFDYENPQIHKAMAHMIKNADEVSVSTKNLKDFFESNFKRYVDVIPNAINTEWIKPVEVHNADSNVIVWRGSETHCGDITYFTDPLYNAISKSSDTWHFLGYNPFTLTNTDLSVKIKCHKGEDVMIYNQNLKLLKPRVMHVPLVDNPLNRAKSNIAWIEATCAGAATIGPNWEEWKRPGVICYDTMEDYANLLTEPRDFSKEWKASMDYINENLLLTTVNKQRVSIIKRLLSECPSTLTETQTE